MFWHRTEYKHVILPFERIFHPLIEESDETGIMSSRSSSSPNKHSERLTLSPPKGVGSIVMTEPKSFGHLHLRWCLFGAVDPAPSISCLPVYRGGFAVQNLPLPWISPPSSCKIAHPPHPLLRRLYHGSTNIKRREAYT